MIESNIKPVKDFSVTEFQALNHRIYGTTNDRYFETWRIIARMQMFVGRMLTALRTDEATLDRLLYYLPMANSWLMALANRVHLTSDNPNHPNFEELIWTRFPGVCRYCQGRPCLGPEVCKREMILDTHTPPYIKPRTLREFQKMFAEIYPQNQLEALKSHMAEEAFEVMEAFEHFCGKDDDELFEELCGEAIDVFTFIIGVCNYFKIDLASEMEVQFAKGCPKCSLLVCNCKHWAAKLK